MILPLAVSTSSMMLILLGSAALILYVAGRFSIGAMPASLDRSGPRALIACVPVFAIAIIGVLMGRPILALHLPIACAAAAMTFGLSAVLAGRAMPADAPTNRSWALVVPAVAMLLIAALGGRLDLGVLGSLVAYGMLALGTWSADPVEPTLEGSATTSVQLAAALWFVGIVTACIAGVLAMHGTDHLDAVRTRASDSLVAVFLLAPAIVLPFFFELLPPCRSIGFGGSVSSLLKFALVCICFIVPLTAVCAQYWPTLMPIVSALGTSATQPATQPAATIAVLPSLPVVATRADLLVLVGVSMLLIPLGSGWVKPGKLEALVLLVCYVMNLLMVIASSV